MSHPAGEREAIHQQVKEAYDKHAGNISAMARELGKARSTVQEHVKNMGLGKKPLAGGTQEGMQPVKLGMPAKGSIKRYLVTSAQNNTFVHTAVWDNLMALAVHYDAEIMVGTFSYNQNAYGELAVKAGTCKADDKELWFDPLVKPYLCDHRVQLGKGLVWCGEMNIIPTEENPLSGLETYSQRQSAIFPHAKMAMRSVSTMLEEGTKLNYTTGTVTQKNYIQKKAGLKAEHHHKYGALLVEVNHDGNWWVRQIGSPSDGSSLQDLNVYIEGGRVVSTSAKAEAITFGDIHATMADPEVTAQNMKMLDELKPKYTFLHDVLEGASINRHALKLGANDPHYKFQTWLRGYHRLEAELTETRRVIEQYVRPCNEIIIPYSNHDTPWLKNWLSRHDYRVDPPNAELFMKLQQFCYAELRKGTLTKDINVLRQALLEVGMNEQTAKCLLPDESFLICNRKIECGQHGHLGPNGSMGSPNNLTKMSRRANTGHTHTAGIYNGLYVAGTSTKLVWSYNIGPSAWTHSHIVTYGNGQRTIVTQYAGKWRASGN